MPRWKLDVAPAPPAIGNPLTGLVPYASPPENRFPHSMEFRYFSLSDLMVGPREFRWDSVEQFLENVRRRGNQAIFRVWMQYPGQPGGIPDFLLRDGLKVHRWRNTNTAPFPPADVTTPDYSDKRLRAALVRFIEALGARYDGDPRIAYLTAGLLGTWGEWHDYPRTDLWASKAVQNEVMDAYRSCLRRTPVLLRTPAGASDPHYAPTRGRGFGYHDDSFCWATVETGREEDSWFFEARLRAAGELDTWRKHPIGGEIRPEAWGIVFDNKPGPKEMQPFDRCVERTHATWLMDTGMFREPPPAPRLAQAIEAVRRMGFAPQVRKVAFELASKAGPQARVQATVEWANVGNAPHYHGWTAEASLTDAKGDVPLKFAQRPALSGIQPGQSGQWVFSAPLGPVSREVLRGARLQIRIPNPMAGGKPIRFANAGGENGSDGWLPVPVRSP